MYVYVIQVYGSLNMSKPLRKENVEDIGTGVWSLRIINEELYCCTLDSIEVFSKDLQLQRSITSSSGGWICDVAERDEDHVFIATDKGLVVFTKSGKNIA